MPGENPHPLMENPSSAATENPYPTMVAPPPYTVQVKSELPPPAEPAAPTVSGPSEDCSEHFFHKNRLQHYTQVLSIPLPIYQTVNEGLPHDPKFRSTVLVDGASYTSPNVYSHRKPAEQDAAKYALHCISTKVKDEGSAQVLEHQPSIVALQPSPIDLHQAKPQQSLVAELTAEEAPQPSMAKPSSAAEDTHPTMVNPLLSVVQVKPGLPMAELPGETVPDLQPTMVTRLPSIVQMKSELSVAEPPAETVPDPQPTMVTPPPSILQVMSELPAAKLPAETIPSSNDCPKRLLHKQRLHQYAQVSSIPIPKYQTINEGLQHVPKFRSTVLVGGSSYSSQNTYLHRKEAEHDAANYAFECIAKKLKDEGPPLILEDTTFCKSILNEFAAKMNMGRPIYSTIRSESLIPVFVSSAIFNGVSYTGDAGKSKKEAERRAARAIIQSYLGGSGSGTLLLSWIIQSKTKLFAALPKAKDANVPVVFPNKGNEHQAQVVEGTQSSSVASISEIPVGQLAAAVRNPPLHEFQKPKVEPSFQASAPLIAFVPPVFEHTTVISSTPSKKRKRKNKKSNEVLVTSTSASALPVNEVPPQYSAVAQ